MGSKRPTFNPNEVTRNNILISLTPSITPSIELIII